jgi:hypothetical protein
MQATVDHELRFTSFEIGWPGSVTDVKVFQNSHLWLRRRDYFKNGECILVDKGYMSTPYTIRPFDEPELREAQAFPYTRKRMKLFNKRLSSVRISVEHAFGILKGRFHSLKDMGPHQEMATVYRVLEAMLILHNMCIQFGDRPEDVWSFELQDELTEAHENGDNVVVDEEEDIPGIETRAYLKQWGREKRNIILDELFPPGEGY